jgi:hypothetical protein
MRTPHCRWAGRAILVTRAIQQWSQHLHDPISQETLDVQRANDLSKNSFATQIRGWITVILAELTLLN